MRQTTILYPLDDDIQQSQIKTHKDRWKSIKMHLDEMKEGEDISFDELLLAFKVTEENYLLTVRSSLNVARVFWKEAQMN